MTEDRIAARLRALPAVKQLLDDPAFAHASQVAGHATVVAAIRAELDRMRLCIRRGDEVELDREALARHVVEKAGPTLRPALNATGVIVHTNLGRAPLAAEAIQAVQAIAAGYSSLEYDLHAGRRGSRHDHARRLICELTGAEDAAIVNNNAGAVLLALATLAVGREVVVSRGELVEIGGGFRIPDVMRQSGARLVEVGCTNRTHARDYVDAIGEDTALLLKVHRSNFDLVGFVAEVEPSELASIASLHHVALMVDAGSGCLLPMPAIPDEVSVAQMIRDGADLVTFSGDKLLGGPQAGILCGRAELIQQIRQHPLMRALRPDKLCLAALHATLRLWRDAPQAVPTYRMMTVDPEHLRQRAQALRDVIVQKHPSLRCQVVASIDRVGGGASPRVQLNGWALRLGVDDADALCARLREGDPPLIARIEDDAVLVHLRCLPDERDAAVAAQLARALGGER